MVVSRDWWSPVLASSVYSRGFGARSVEFGSVRVSTVQVRVKHASSVGPARVEYGSSTGHIRVKCGSSMGQVRVKYVVRVTGVQSPLSVPDEARSGAPEDEPRAAQSAH